MIRRLARAGARRMGKAKGLPAHWFNGYREYPDPVACQRKPEPGTSVRFHGQYLRNTGQLTGGEGRRIWAVQACACSLCQLGRHVAVDQLAYAGDAGSGPWRHVAWTNLQDVDAWDRLERGQAAERQRRREKFEAGM